MRIAFIAFLTLCSFAVAAQDSTRVLVSGTVTHAVSQGTVHCTVELFDGNGVKLAVTDVNNDGLYALIVPTDVRLELRIAQQGYDELAIPFGPVPAGARTFGLPLVLQPTRVSGP